MVSYINATLVSEISPGFNQLHLSLEEKVLKTPITRRFSETYIPKEWWLLQLINSLKKSHMQEEISLHKFILIQICEIPFMIYDHLA